MTFDLWTLGFQAVNVLVLIWLLHRFFWKPVAGIIAQRESAAAALLGDAEAKRTAAEAELAGIATTRAKLTDERDAMLATARKDAATARDAVLADAQSEVDVLHDTAKAARIHAAAVLKKNAMNEAQGLAITIAARLAARLDGPAIDAAFLGWLVAGLTALPAAERAALAGSQMELLSAADQDRPAQKRIAAGITSALGAPAILTFRTDPALIAGYELCAPHFSLRNSWQADLALIAAALGQDRELPDAQ